MFNDIPGLLATVLCLDATRTPPGTLVVVNTVLAGSVVESMVSCGQYSTSR